MIDEAKEREAFEKWYCNEHMMPLSAFRQIEGTYEIGFVREAWEAWEARAKLETQWIACSERLPEVVKSLDGGINAVLCWGPDRPDCGHDFGVSNTLFLGHGNLKQKLYTHWMPLPPPPY